MSEQVTHRVLREPRVTQKELAERLQLSRKTISRMEERGELPEKHKLGSMSFWTESQINKWIEENFKAARQEGVQ